jgi:hypothetical protein
VSTKDRASMAALGPLTHTIIKARQHNVVLVQNVDPVTARSLNASIPSIRQTSIFRFAVKRHAPRAKSMNNFQCGIVARAVINYFDLHLVRPRILLKNAP